MKTFNKKVIAFLFVYSISLTSLPLGEIYANPETQKVKKDKTIEKATENALTPNKLDELNKPKASLATPNKPKDITNENIRETSREASDNLEEWTRDCFTWTTNDYTEVTGLSPIGEGKIKGKTDVKIKIPEGTKLIYQNAFKNKNISEVVFPHSLEVIENYAFQGNNISKLDIPDSVIEINTGAFMNNKITELKLSNNLKSISALAFLRNEIKKIDIPDSVKKIERLAFQHNKLDEVVIPSGVTSIGEEAFSTNRIRSITIPSTGTHIGNKAFSNQHFIYKPKFPIDFQKDRIGIRNSREGDYRYLFDYYGPTFSTDRSTKLWPAGGDQRGKWYLLKSKPGKSEFAFDTRDKYQYSGIMEIEANYRPSEEDKPTGDIKIWTVDKDDPTKQLEGAEFEIIEIEEIEEDKPDAYDWLIWKSNVDKLELGARLPDSEIRSMKNYYKNYGYDDTFSIESDFIIKQFNGWYVIEAEFPKLHRGGKMPIYIIPKKK